jgi:hypothetical protein
MADLGWDIARLQFPPCLHICVGLRHTSEVVETWLSDLEKAVAAVKETPEKVYSFEFL